MFRSHDTSTAAKTFDPSNGLRASESAVELTPILHIEGLFTCNEIYPVSDIRTSLILYYIIEFWYKWVCHPLGRKAEIKSVYVF